MTPPFKNHYATLSIKHDAKKAEISTAYKRLALKHHPDKHSTPEAKEKNTVIFRNVQEAYEVLSDASRRKDYDLEYISLLTGITQINSTSSPSSNSNPSPFFNSNSSPFFPWRRNPFANDNNTYIAASRQMMTNHGLFTTQAVLQKDKVATCYADLNSYWNTQVIPEIQQYQPLALWRKRSYRYLMNGRMQKVRSRVGLLDDLTRGIDKEWGQFHQRWEGQISTDMRKQMAYREVLDIKKRVEDWEKKMDEMMDEVENYLEGVFVLKERYQ